MERQDKIDEDLMNLPTSFRANLKPKQKKVDDLKNTSTKSFRKKLWNINPDGRIRDRAFRFGRSK